MENKIACIKDGLVENIIVSSDEFAQTLGYDQIVNITNITTLVDIGMKYENGMFLMPPDEAHSDWWNPNIQVTRL